MYTVRLDNRSVDLYFYNGFEEPREVSIEDLTLEHNYKGDVTDDFHEEYIEVVKNFTLKDRQYEQPLSYYSIWINPTREQLEEFNKSVGISKDAYLEEFAGYKEVLK